MASPAPQQMSAYKIQLSCGIHASYAWENNHGNQKSGKEINENIGKENDHEEERFEKEHSEEIECNAQVQPVGW
jgi:hypothetical protein